MRHKTVKAPVAAVNTKILAVVRTTKTEAKMMRVKGAGSRTPRSGSHLPAMRGEKRFFTGVENTLLELIVGL